MIFEFEHHIFAIYSCSRFSKLQTKYFAQIAYSFSACKGIKDENIEEVRFLFPVKYIVQLRAIPKPCTFYTNQNDIFYAKF